MLQKAQHDVITANDAGLSGEPDEIVLNFAKTAEGIILTRNCKDFENLHIANPNPPGIFVVYRQANVLKNISFADIVKAIAFP